MRTLAISALASLTIYLWRRVVAENKARNRELYRRAMEARARDRRERYRFN